MGRLTPRIRAAGAEVAAIAVSTIFAQQAFARSLSVDFPLLSDWSRQVCGAYGVRYGEWKGHDGLAKRSMFVIGRDRRVQYAWSTDAAAVLPDQEAIVAGLTDR